LSQTASHPFLPLPKAVEQRPRPRVYNASRLSAAGREINLYVGRRMFDGQRREVSGHPLANPFRLPYRSGGSSLPSDRRQGSERDACLARYEHWLFGIPTLPTLIGHLRRTWLDGVRSHGINHGLVCWCAPEKCHADTLAEYARARKGTKAAVEVVKVPGINHLLVPAKTGDVSEYGTLGTDAKVSPQVTAAIATFLTKVLQD
jgi:hypothetical protein